mmetsp:Transcript_25731/g.75949  ORF Transcript_25731/g.75949 Transcript_25731/m.75949 type:complete len:86 (+) Transcript_25731:237-494(+)
MSDRDSDATVGQKRKEANTTANRFWGTARKNPKRLKRALVCRENLLTVRQCAGSKCRRLTMEQSDCRLGGEGGFLQTKRRKQGGG